MTFKQKCCAQALGFRYLIGFTYLLWLNTHTGRPQHCLWKSRYFTNESFSNNSVIKQTSLVTSSTSMSTTAVSWKNNRQIYQLTVGKRQWRRQSLNLSQAIYTQRVVRVHPRDVVQIIFNSRQYGNVFSVVLVLPLALYVLCCSPQTIVIL